MKDIHSAVLKAADNRAQLHIFSTTEGTVQSTLQSEGFPLPLLKSLDRQAHLCAQRNSPTHEIQARLAETH